MANYKELAAFSETSFNHERIDLQTKITQSSVLLQTTIKDDSIVGDITPESYRLGEIPRLSPYDMQHLSKDISFVRVPKEIAAQLSAEKSHDLIQWNKPSQFLYRLEVAQTEFEPPVEGKSHVMERLAAERTVVSFDDLRSDSPVPKNGRQSRTDINSKIEVNIMGQGRIPFALGSVPDVGSFLSYTTMAMSNGMAFVSRDKVLSDINEQAELVGDVINFLKEVELPQEICPNSDELNEFKRMIDEFHVADFSTPEEERKLLEDVYFLTLRSSWISNIGAAIEADPQKAVKRAEALYEKGCKLFRIYSPEGGTEIVETAKALRQAFSPDSGVKIVGGQIMDLPTAKKAEDAGCDSIIIGVAGGSQCTTSVNADIPVKTPNLLYSLRGNITVPVGIEGGGVGTHLMTAFELGASFVSKPGEIGVSWEGSGGKFVFQDPEGNYYMPYGGEASISAKWWKDSMDSFGRPKFVEGETGVRPINKDKLSMTRNIKRLRDQTSIGLVFQRANTIAEIHAKPCDNIVQVTPDASSLSKAYGQ